MSVPIWDHDLAKLRQELSRESLQCLIPATSTNRFVSLNDFAFGALGSFGEDEAVQMILILLLFYAVFCCFLLVFLIDSGWMVVSKTCVNFHPHVLISDYIMQTHWCSYDIMMYHVDVLHIFARGVAQPPFRQDGDGLPWSGERWRSHSNFWLHGPSGQRNVAKLAKPWSDLGGQNGDFQGFPI